MRKFLQQKKDLNSGSTLYQFISEVGERRFFEHIAKITSFMDIASNKTQFNTLFNKAFGKYEATLFPELDFIDIFAEPKKTKETSNIGSNKFINNIQQDNLELNESGNFEEIIAKVALSKPKKA